MCNPVGMDAVSVVRWSLIQVPGSVGDVTVGPLRETLHPLSWIKVFGKQVEYCRDIHRTTLACRLLHSVISAYYVIFYVSLGFLCLLTRETASSPPQQAELHIAAHS